MANESESALFRIRVTLNVLKAIFFCPGPDGRWGLPILWWGEPGTGKTKTLRSAAAQAGLGAFARLSPAERGMGQFGVVPVPGTDGCLHYPPPDWVKDFEDGGVVLVDDMSLAGPALQAPLLGLLQFGDIGSFRFGPRVRIVGAANRADDMTGVWDLGAAVANRIGHLEWEGLPPSEWARGLLTGFASFETTGGGAREEEERVMRLWPEHYAKAAGLVGAFVERKGDMLHRRPKKGDPASSTAWPSRRTWELATYARASASLHGLDEIETDALMGAFIGAPALTEFRVFGAEMDLPSPSDLLDGRVTFAHDSGRPDRSMAVLNSCAALFSGPAPSDDAGRKLRRARGERAWALIDEIAQHDGDLVIPAAVTLTGARVAVDLKAVKEIFGRLAPFLRNAGMWI